MTSFMFFFLYFWGGGGIFVSAAAVPLSCLSEWHSVCLSLGTSPEGLDFIRDASRCRDQGHMLTGNGRTSSGEKERKR